MKKNFFMLAATAALFAACAETELVNEVNTVAEPQAIGFETFANKATRAENSTQGNKWDLEKHQTEFNVWSAKQLGDGTWVTVYADATPDERVYLDGGAWKVTTTKYWDKAATRYRFYAAAPVANWGYDVNGTATDFSDDFLTLSGVVLNGTNLSTTPSNSISYQDSWLLAGGDIDYLIATDKVVERSFYTGATVEKVNLEFNHILSRLNITVKKSEALNTAGAVVEVTDLTVYGLLNKGNFNEGADLGTDVLTNGTTKRWTTETETETINGLDYTMTNEAAYLVQSLVIPQTAGYEPVDRNGTTAETKPYFEIAYKINGEPYKATYNLAHAFAGENDVKFCEGWQNTLNITINATSIEFDSEVFQWADVVNGSTID